MRTSVVLLLLALTARGVDARSEAKENKEIDAETVAAFEKLGALHGGVVKDLRCPRFLVQVV